MIAYNAMAENTVSKRICYDVLPAVDHWQVAADGVLDSDKYASMYAALLVANEAARVRWADFHQPSCVRVKVDLSGTWRTADNYG